MLSCSSPDVRRSLRRDEWQQHLNVVEQKPRPPPLRRHRGHAHAVVVLQARLHPPRAVSCALPWLNTAALQGNRILSLGLAGMRAKHMRY